MAFNFLNRICSQQTDVDLDDDLGTSVDGEEGDIDRENDVIYRRIKMMLKTT